MRRSAGTANAFTFSVDSFILFKLKMLLRKAQSDLASAIMSPGFQEVFSLNKGSIPVRAGQSMDKFDDCARHLPKTLPTPPSRWPGAQRGPGVWRIAPATEGAIKGTL